MTLPSRPGTGRTVTQTESRSDGCHEQLAASAGAAALRADQSVASGRKKLKRGGRKTAVRSSEMLFTQKEEPTEALLTAPCLWQHGKNPTQPCSEIFT